MKEFSYKISTKLSKEVDLLRMLAFPGENYVITSKDQFDQNCLHVTIEIDKDIAAYARLTPGPNSVFFSWTEGKSSLPNDKYTVDLGRVLVNPKFRVLGFCRWILLECCILSKKLGFKYINGTFIPEETYINQPLYKLGFMNCGEKVIEHESGGISVLVQPVSLEISPNLYSRWTEMKSDIDTSFCNNHFIFGNQ